MGLPLAEVRLLAAGLRLVAGQRHLAALQPALLPPVPLPPAHLRPAHLRPAHLLPAHLLPAYLLPAYLLPPAVGRRRLAPARRPLLSASCPQEAQRRPSSRRAVFAVSS